MSKKIYLFIMIVALSICGCQRQSKNSSWNMEGEEQSPENSMDDEKAEISKILYLCGDLSVNKTQAVRNGIQKRCNELGLDLAVVDCKGRESVFTSALEDLESIKADALIITAANEKLGPIIEEKCKEASLPLISIESRLKNSEGQSLPYVDDNAYANGAAGARALVKQAEARGFLENGKKTEVLLLNMSFSESVSQTTRGFLDTFEQEMPALHEGSYKILEVSDTSVEKQYLSVKSYYEALDNDSNYIMAAFNDEGGAALAKYVAEKENAEENTLICSIGGLQYAYEIFAESGTIAERYFSVYVDAEALGEEAVDMLCQENLEASRPAAAEEIILSEENYRDYLTGK